MFRVKAVQAPSVKEALVIVLLMLSVLSYSMIRLGVAPHIPILISIFILIVYGLAKQIPYQSLEIGFIEGAKAGLSAVFLFFLIGVLLSSWLMGGTIPTLMYAGFELVTPQFFFVIVFVVTSIIGVSIGSAFTTAGTVGVALLGVAQALDLSLAITAGAIVSGAFFGDKMSPLSDTTNLASSIVKVDLFTHIRNMGWTTIPAFLISAGLFALLSPNLSSAPLENVAVFQTILLDTDLISVWTLLPFIVLLVLTLLKKPAILNLAASSGVSIVMILLTQSVSATEMMNVLYGGFQSDTGNAVVDQLLTRGGIESMMFTVSLVLLALGLGGILFTLGIIQTLIHSIERFLTKTSSVVTAAASTGFSINVLIGEQYLSILLTGEAYQASFQKNNLAPKNLSRVLEDAGTVVNPLVPWSVSGVFLTSVLGVPTLDYLPFAFFCLLCPLLTLVYGFTGISLAPLERETTGTKAIDVSS